MAKSCYKYNLESSDCVVAAAVEDLWVPMGSILMAANEARLYVHTQRRKLRCGEPVVGQG